MKKLFIFLSTIFLAVMTMAAWAQENPKLSYQAVVRDNQNKLLTNSTVNVEINILKPNDAVQYTETFSAVPTNQNGLMSLLIGNKPSWDNVDWIKAKINVKITLPGGMGMVESTSDVSAVPLAISALYADSVNLEAVPQSDWDETNPAKCTFIKNKPNIPDTIKDQLADGNSVINHIVDTIVDNHIQWATDTLISNRELRDTASILRGLIHAATGDVGDLAMRVDNFNRHVCDSVKGCVTGWIADSMEVVRDSIEDIRGDMGNMNDDILDSITRVNNHVRDTIRIVNNALNHRIDTTSEQIRSSMHIADSTLQAGIDTVIDHLADTASTLRTLIGTTNNSVLDSITRVNNHVRDTIRTINTALNTRIDTTASQSLLRDNALAERIRLDSIRLTEDSAYLKGLIDNLGNHTSKAALCDSVSDCVAAAMDSRHYLTSDSTIIKNMNDTLAKHNTRISANYRGIIDTANKIRTDIATTLSAYEIKTCADVMACPDIQKMRDSIQTNKNAIVANATAISDEITNRTAADTEIKGIIKADSTDIMKNVSDTATAIRALITGAHGDVGKLNQKVDSLNNNLFDTLHIKYVTNTVLADTIKDVRDSISALRDSMTTNYVSNADLCEKVMACDDIQTMRDSIQTNASNIHADSIFFAGRITDLSDSVKMNIKAIADSSKNIRNEIADTASTLRGLISDANKDVKALKDSVEHNYVSNTKLNDTLNHYINEVALADSLITKSGLADTASAIRSALVDTAGNLRAAINDINTSMCNTIMNCDGITEMKGNISTNTSDIAANKEKIKADSTLFADRIQELSDSVKINITAIADSSAKIRNEIKDTANVLRGLITNANNGVKALKDSVEHNYVSNNDLCDKVMACPDIQKMRDSIQINTQAIIDTAAAIRANYDSLVTNTRTQIANVTESLQNNIDSTSQHVRTALVDTAKHLRDAINDINTSMCNTIMSCTGIQTMQTSISTNTTNISTNTSNIAANATKIAEDSTLFADRIKNLSDSVKMNVQAIIDSSKNIRKEIKDTASTLRGLITDANKDVKALKDSVEHNYVSNTKLNDTLNHYINEVALTDSIITKSGLADTASAIRTFVTTNYVSNSDLCDKVKPCVNTQMKELRDSVNTLYVHTTKAALRDSVAGQIHDSLSTFSSTLHTHTNKTILDATTASYLEGEKTKLAGIADGAEVNVNADWSATEGDAQILNKPTTISGYGITDAKIVGGKVILGTDTVTVSEHAEFEALLNRVNTFFANICDTVMACDDIQTMRDSIQINAANIKADSSFFAGRIKNLSDSVKINITAIADSSAKIRNEIKDTANVLRSLITNANNGVKALKDSVEHNYVSNTKLNDTLNHYINEVALTDSIITKSGLADTASAIRSALVDTAGNLRAAINDINTSMCNTIMNCDGITEMKGNISTNTSDIAANKEKIKADSTLFADRIQELSDSVKINITAIADSSAKIRNEIKDTANVLRSLITNANNGVKALKDSVEHNYVSNTKLNDTLTHYINEVALTDSIITKSGLADTASAIRSALVDTAGNLRAAINDINTSMCNTIMNCDGITEMKGNISSNTSDIAANATKIAEDSTLFADRIKNLSDSVKLNIKAIADSSAKIRNEIKDTANVLRGLITNANNGVKALKDSVEHNYVSNTKLNDTLTHYINEVALTDSIITKSGLADTASAIRSALVDTAGNLRAAINDINTSMCNTIMNCDGITEMKGNISSNTSDIAANATKIAEDSTLFADRIKNLSDSVKLNIKAIADSSKNIREEIKDTANVLRGLITNANNGVKALKDSVEHNYVSNTKLNDTLSNYTPTSGLATVATSGSYNDLNDKPTIPTVNDATLTIQKNGTTVGTFSANASEAVTANVNVYDGKLYIKFNGDTLGQFSADYKDTLAVNINLKQLSTRLILNENTVDTLDYVEDGLDTTGLVLSIPTGYTQVDTANMLIQFYRNGVYVADTKDGSDIVKFIGGKLYYYPARNDNKECKVGDRIQVVYWVK